MAWRDLTWRDVTWLPDWLVIILLLIVQSFYCIISCKICYYIIYLIRLGRGGEREGEGRGGISLHFSDNHFYFIFDIKFYNIVVLGGGRVDGWMGCGGLVLGSVSAQSSSSSPQYCLIPPTMSKLLTDWLLLTCVDFCWLIDWLTFVELRWHVCSIAFQAKELQSNINLLSLGILLFSTISCAPHPSPLTPHPSPLTPHPSPLTSLAHPLPPLSSTYLIICKDTIPWMLPLQMHL